MTSKYRFILIDEAGEVSGTDSEEIAKAAASAGVDCIVIDIHQSKRLQDDGNLEDAEIPEAGRGDWIEDDEDEDDEGDE